MLLRGKEGLIHQTGKNIQNIFQNIFKQRSKWRREAMQLHKYYSEDVPHAKDDTHQVIAMFDGKMKHGGLVDRLRGIVSMWSVCKNAGIPFKINFVDPFDLQKFLEPNKVDWRITQDDITYNSNEAFPVFCGSNNTHVEPPFQRLWLKQNFTKKGVLQVHAYSNAHLMRGSNFAPLFHELFKPTPALQERLDINHKAIGGKYVAMATRFQSLLNDLDDCSEATVMPAWERKQFIDCVIYKIKELHEKECPDSTVLVTSDSMAFLREAEKLPFVYVVPGDVVHIDYTEGDQYETYMKVFVDFFMLMGAEKIYMLQTGKMYNGGFPRRAAQAGNVPFKHVRFPYKAPFKKYYLMPVKDSNELHAGSKAVRDVITTLNDLGYEPLKWKVSFPIHAMRYLKEYLMLRRIRNGINKNDIILLQWPEYEIRFIHHLYEALTKHPRFHILIHDINTLRHFSSGNKMEKEFFRLAEMVIVHTPAMKEYIMQWGVKEDRIRVLTTFDYYIDSIKIPYRANSNDIVYAGNLAKTDKSFLRKFCKAVVGNVTLNCYGREVGKLGDACLYKGSFTPDCVSEIEGSWGLVWDGPSLNSCKGDMGRYLRWNSPHKLSLYIVSGLPVIVWKNSALADYVLQKDLGIAITNLQNIDKEIEKISAHRYNHMLEALKQEAEQLRSGRHLKNILEE